MGIAIHRTTKRVHTGVDVTDTTRFPPGTWFTLSRPLGDEAAIVQFKALVLAAVPSYYWNLDDGPPKALTEMTQPEKDVVDAARAAATDDKLLTLESQFLLAPIAPHKDYQEFFDDFLGGVDPHFWSVAGVGGSVAQISPGVVRISTDSVLGTEQKGIFSNNLMVQVAGFQHLAFRMREETQGNQVVIGGLYADANNYLAFARQNAGNWLAVANKAGVMTPVNTGVGGDTGYHVFRFDKIGTDAAFRIDGKEVATIAGANAPTGLDLEFSVRVMANTAAQPNRSVDLDALRYRIARP